MTLYEMTGAALNLQELLQAEEIDEQVYNDTLESLNTDEKLENVCKIIRNLESDAEAYKKEKDRLATRQKVAENAVKRLKESVLKFLQATNKDKVQTGLFKLSLGKSEKVIVNDMDLIPEQYLNYVPAKVNLTELKKDIKSGLEIPGVEIEKNEYVLIR